jgi:hypothetical protein
MKNIKVINRVKSNLILLVSGLFLMGVIISCTQKIDFTESIMKEISNRYNGKWFTYLMFSQPVDAYENGSQVKANAVEVWDEESWFSSNVVIYKPQGDMSNRYTHWLQGGETSDSITLYQSGIYGISLSPMGCTILQDTNIECPCKLYIPNIITLNGDSLNDVFIPLLEEEGAVLDSFSMSIYDRWGALVYQTNTYSPWDGTQDRNYATGNGGALVYQTNTHSPLNSTQNENYGVGNYVYTYIIYYSCMNSPDIIRKEQGRITVIR